MRFGGLVLIGASLSDEVKVFILFLKIRSYVFLNVCVPGTEVLSLLSAENYTVEFESRCLSSWT